ncbi:MAG: flippase-like domain-containing protein [Actinomycetota bacterium]|nr:flippase-like domain-containing protein [Actinomycetota bacterium]
MSAVPTVATLGDSFRSFFDAVEEFFANLAAVQWGSLAVALLAFGTYLTLRSRASYNILRAAYPDKEFRWREIWGAYMAGYGFNSVIPARGGDLVRLFLTKNSIPQATYPATGAAFTVELGFDLVVGGSILIFAFTQGVFPKPPDLSKLNAFELSYFAQHPRFTLFLLTTMAIGAIVATALLSARVRAFWAGVRQGLTIAFDRRRYLREVFAIQAAGWVFRFTAFWFLLEAFNVGGSVKNVLLVLGVQAVSAALPFTPGGAGAQQALLVKVFGGSSTVAAYSVGQQIAIAAFTFAVGFVALAVIFRIRSFKEVIARGRAQREEEGTGRKAPAEV